jgi:uncharacterized protein YecT (DUF1311 family)
MAVILALYPTAPPAQADPSADADAVAACLSETWPQDPRTLCAGIVSTPCERETGADPARTSAQCLTRETAAWHLVLERQMPELRRRAAEIDAGSPQAADGINAAAAALETAQRAWLTYRDSECRSAYASWGAEEFRTVAHAACMLDLTLRRVVDFQARLMVGG